jgi:hypothetical protein
MAENYRNHREEIAENYRNHREKNTRFYRNYREEKPGFIVTIGKFLSGYKYFSKNYKKEQRKKPNTFCRHLFQRN